MSKTQYLTVVGTTKWAKLYKPDEFRGAVNWTLNLYPRDEAEWKKIKDAGLQGKPKEDEDGKYMQFRRPTTKLMGKKLVSFTPPAIYDANGKPLVIYTDKAGKQIFSYDDPDLRVEQKGDFIQVGNGSLVELRLSYYPTQMGVGNRFEAIKILELIEYEPMSESEVASTDIDDEIPF